MRQDILKVASSFRPLLLAHGYFPETVDRWIYKTQDELLNLKVHMYIKVSTRPSVIQHVTNDSSFSGTAAGQSRGDSQLLVEQLLDIFLYFYSLST